MLLRYLRACAALMFASALIAGQADQAANADKNKKKDTTPDLTELMGGPHFDKAAVERGRAIFVPTCGFCHGNDAHGKSGPDLVRSALVAHDDKGSTIGAVLRDGRPSRGMPAFPQLTPDQVADISTFLHSRAADVTNRFAYKIGDIVTGDPHKGEQFFNGMGHCNSCHSPTGDLAHVAGKYDAVELQRRLLYPAPNWMAMFTGQAVKPPAPTKVTVHLAPGKQVSGILDHIDEFNVSLHDANGWYKSYSRDSVTVDVQDPRAAHAALLPKYTDDEMHNVLAYLETLK